MKPMPAYVEPKCGAGHNPVTHSGHGDDITYVYTVNPQRQRRSASEQSGGRSDPVFDFETSISCRNAKHSIECISY